ncbi:YigZ family protein [Kangiella sp. TOML190]|uniref:YigZ family protein n=1 Tax=Kangiella sp. TOML190 TaxID=2931351 RepID=UPI002041B1D5|nr:YigZ family protein [Kangiella sp. TOML190]
MAKMHYSVPNQSLRAESPFQVEEVIKGSRFITRVIFSPEVTDAKAFIKQLNQTEPEATHHCWAYIVGNPNSTTLMACSDDGEPSGTAGMPMLNVLKYGDIGDITAVVTRYYGGTKLGTGGLARAYGGGVKLALETLPIQQRIFTEQLQLSCAYDLQNQIDYLLKEHQATINQIDYSESVDFQVEVPQDQLQILLAAFQAYQNKNQLEVVHVSGN